MAEQVLVQPLTDYLALQVGPTQTNQVRRMGQIFEALQTSLESL